MPRDVIEPCATIRQALDSIASVEEFRGFHDELRRRKGKLGDKEPTEEEWAEMATRRAQGER